MEWWTVSVPSPPAHDRMLSRHAELLGAPGVTLSSSWLYFLEGSDGPVGQDQIERVVASCLRDPMGGTVEVCAPGETTDGGVGGGDLRIEVALRPGVTDRVATQLRASAAALGVRVRVATGRAHVMSGATGLDATTVSRFVDNLLANPVIETWSVGQVTPGFVDEGSSLIGGASSGPSEATDQRVALVPITALADADLVALSVDRGLALDIVEMAAVRDWYAAAGREPTDAELETIAQTWSEHCSHKTFRAPILADGCEIEPLLDQLRRATREVNAPFVVSAFDGNAGIVAFPGQRPLAVKMETHNHPSAIEPFGGANTGVGGVVRDVLAAPAWPVALTDVLCFAPPSMPVECVPGGALHPAVVAEGVVAGVADYGNKIGVPTVAGAVLYDEHYAGNPLVFCGCVGEVMEGQSALSTPQPGDAIVVVGGATGRDGLKGATFSSMTMDASTGQVAGASVQIGDPITERLVMEALAELCDRPDPLVRALTDCGAGGLSSAVGEMAEHVGATVHLEAVTRKYPGLAPWEVWLSEAQERMVLAVAPDKCGEVVGVCTRRGVEADVIGTFGGDGRLLVLDGDAVVVDLPGSFLHRGRPQQTLRATTVRASAPWAPRHIDNHEVVLLRLLGHPNIASKEAIVRRYDHEVRGATVIGPMSARLQTGPSDGAVIAEPAMPSGFSVTVGINPRYGEFDTRAMAWATVDEAVRNAVVLGADPDAVALMDNFSWGDPRRAETLGQLVEAVNGCCEASLAYGAPFVSGKDSLHNEYESRDGRRVAIPPTLVISAIAHVPDADAVPSSGFVEPGNLVVVVGATRDELCGSHLDLVQMQECGGRVPGPDPAAPARYRAVHRAIRAGLVRAAHDPSEGGIAVALAEMCLAGRLGADADLSDVHVDPVVALYSESAGRILIEVRESDHGRLEEMLLETAGERATVIGRVRPESGLDIVARGARIAISDREMRDAWEARP